MEPKETCTGPLIARKDSRLRPVCWNFNSSIVANQNCRAPADGTLLPSCMEIGITSTAFIPECSKKETSNCGTFLEVHQPGSREILTEVRLSGQFMSGYKMAVISMNYRRDQTRVLCEGDHEVRSCPTSRANDGGPMLACLHPSTDVVGAPNKVGLDRGTKAPLPYLFATV